VEFAVKGEGAMSRNPPGRRGGGRRKLTTGDPPISHASVSAEVSASHRTERKFARIPRAGQQGYKTVTKSVTQRFQRQKCVYFAHCSRVFPLPDRLAFCASREPLPLDLSSLRTRTWLSEGPETTGCSPPSLVHPTAI
jgi:hypothetical protein